MTEVKWVTVKVKPRLVRRRYSRFLNRRHYTPPSTDKCIDITPQSMKDEIIEEHMKLLIDEIERTRND